MTPVRRHSRHVLLAVAACSLLLSACATRRSRYPATTPPVRLVADAGFQLWTPATATAPPTVACTVHDVDGLVSALHGDTVSLTQLRVRRHAASSPECPDLRTGFVVVSDQVELRARVDTATGIGEFFGIGWALTVAVLGGAALLLVLL